MTTGQRVQTVPRPAAGYVAWGVVLLVLAVPVLLASAYAGLTHTATEYGNEPSAGLVLAWIGWLGLAAAAAVLGVGIFRLVQHHDRAAGVTYPPSTQAGSS